MRKNDVNKMNQNCDKSQDHTYSRSGYIYSFSKGGGLHNLKEIQNN
jgi:hypothetical protein